MSQGWGVGYSSPNRKSKLRQSVAAVLASAQTLVPSAATTASVAGGAVMLTSCETEQVDPEGLTAEEQAFVDLLKPHADGSLKSITIDIGDPQDPYFMPGLFRIEMRLINAKQGTYEITPWISKKPIEDVLKKAYAENPDQYGPAADIALVVKRPDGSTYSPTSTFGIQLKDDNNPATKDPTIDELPESFTMDYLTKFFTLSGANLKKSYTLGKNEELQLWINTIAVGKQFATVKLPVQPLQVLASTNNQTGN